MFALILAIFIAVSATSAIGAEPCQETACVNVYTDNNQIIIEARKGNSTVKKTIAQAPKTVSYTHLRAHETDQYLVCRLLLEKNVLPCNN